MPARLAVTWPALLPLLCTLSACNGPHNTYPSGPWGRAYTPGPEARLYSGAWSTPHLVLVDEVAAVPVQPVPSVPRRSEPEPMEPIGPWASRHVEPRLPSGSDGVFSSRDWRHETAPATAMINTDNVQSAAPSATLSKAPETSEGRAPVRGFTALTGNWIAQQEDGGSCRLHLTSVPALDLYKASVSRCTNAALQTINAWSLREGNIVLYSRGSVVARLTGGSSSFAGTLEGSGGRIKISR